MKTDDAVAEKQALQDSDDEITVPLGEFHKNVGIRYRYKYLSIVMVLFSSVLPVKL